MHSTDVCLGSAILQSRESDICVELQSSAQFAAFEEDDIDQLRRRLIEPCLTDQGGDMPWIHCGSTFKLVLSIQAGSVLDVTERDELGELLAGHMQHAKVSITVG